MARPSIKIEVRHDTLPARSVVLDKELVTVGKKDSNDICLNEDGISRLHARLRVASDGITVEDCSTNGTFVIVDGRKDRITSQRSIGHQGLVDVGRFTLCIALIDEDSLFTALSDAPISEVGGEFASGPSPEPTVPPPDKLFPPVWGGRDGGSAPLSGSTPLPNEEGLSGTQPLGLVYRRLVRELGGNKWGLPVAVQASRLREVEALASAHLTRAGLETSWSSNLAQEICGADPLSRALSDRSIQEVIVHGASSVDTRSGGKLERLPRTFSCAEAVHSVFARITGRELRVEGLQTYADDEVTLHALPGSCAPHGPIIVARRNLADSSHLPVPEAALYYLRRALAAGAAFLIAGSMSDLLTRLARQLTAELSPTLLTVVVQRVGGWSPARWLIVDGAQPVHELWRCISRLSGGWLVIEELNGKDVSHLDERSHGRLIATYRLGPLDSQPERAVTGHFDVYIEAREDNGHTPILSISESRNGSFVELFTRGNDGVLSATGESPAL